MQVFTQPAEQMFPQNIAKPQNDRGNAVFPHFDCELIAERDDFAL
jgi:hypothetical protein